MKKPANWNRLRVTARAKWFATGRLSAVRGTALVDNDFVDGWRPKVKGHFVRPTSVPPHGLYPTKDAALAGARDFREHCRIFK